MKNHNRRVQEVAGEVRRRVKDPLSTLYGFLVQWSRSNSFNPFSSDRASMLFLRLTDAAGLNAVVNALREQKSEDGHSASWFLGELKGHVGDLLNVNRTRTRELRNELRLLTSRALPKRQRNGKLTSSIAA